MRGERVISRFYIAYDDSVIAADVSLDDYLGLMMSPFCIISHDEVCFCLRR